MSKLAGEHKVFITAKAIKVESIKNRYAILCKAPDWKVVAYNPVSKLYFDVPLKNFKGDLANGTDAFGGYLQQLPISRGAIEKTTFLRQPATRVHVVNPNARESLQPKKSTFNGVFFSQGEIMAFDYWTWENGELPVAANILLNKVYRLPQARKVPLKLATQTTEKEVNIELNTTSLKKVPLVASNFELPKNLKRVKEELGIINDSRRQNQVKNLIDNWDGWGKIVEPSK